LLGAWRPPTPVWLESAPREPPAVTDQTPQSKGLRICLRLDPAMLVEALILKRLAALPKPRHPEWLRSLLTQGFLAESRVLQALHRATRTHSGDERSVRPSRPMGLSFGNWLGGAAGAGGSPKGTVPPPQTSPSLPPVPSPTDKPFAHLSKVIG
jgi:hypothetical protein